jgi:hypothetical protein
VFDISGRKSAAFKASVGLDDLGETRRPGGMAEAARIQATDLEAAIRVYGLHADSKEPLASGCCIDGFRVKATAEGTPYASVRHGKHL